MPSGEPEDVETNVDEPAATDEVPSARLETDDDAYFADEPGVAYRTDYDDEPFVKGRVR